jgi:hypothetical protein
MIDMVDISPGESRLPSVIWETASFLFWLVHTFVCHAPMLLMPFTSSGLVGIARSQRTMIAWLVVSARDSGHYAHRATRNGAISSTVVAGTGHGNIGFFPWLRICTEM